MRRPHDTLPPAITLIRDTLQARGMTIKELAVELGYTNAEGRPTPYLYSVLNGSVRLTRDQITRIAQLLDLDADDLSILNGTLDPDLEYRLKTDRNFLRAVRQLAHEGVRPQASGDRSTNEVPDASPGTLGVLTPDASS